MDLVITVSLTDSEDWSATNALVDIIERVAPFMVDNVAVEVSEVDHSV